MISDKRELSHLVNGKFTTNLIREIHQWQLKGLRTYKLFRFYEHTEQRKNKIFVFELTQKYFSRNTTLIKFQYVQISRT